MRPHFLTFFLCAILLPTLSLAQICDIIISSQGYEFNISGLVSRNASFFWTNPDNSSLHYEVSFCSNSIPCGSCGDTSVCQNFSDTLNCAGYFSSVQALNNSLVTFTYTNGTNCSSCVPPEPLVTTIHVHCNWTIDSSNFTVLNVSGGLQGQSSQIVIELASGAACGTPLSPSSSPTSPPTTPPSPPPTSPPTPTPTPTPTPPPPTSPTPSPTPSSTPTSPPTPASTPSQEPVVLPSYATVLLILIFIFVAILIILRIIAMCRRKRESYVEIPK